MSKAVGFSMHELIEDSSSDARANVLQDVSANNGTYVAPLAGDDQIVQLVQRLFTAQSSKTPQVLVFAGVDAGAGCNSLCSATARALAVAAPDSVCLIKVGGDDPESDSSSGTIPRPGLAEALLQNGSIQGFATHVAKENLWFIGAGQASAGTVALLHPERVEACIAELRSAFEFVLFSCPPLSSHADALSLGRWSDGLVLVLEAHGTSREIAKEAVQSVRAADIPILGAVLHKTQTKRRRWPFRS